jgi:hypothetical protein
VNTGGPKFEEVTPKCTPFDGKVDVVNLPKASIFDFVKFGIAKHHHRLAESHLYEYGQLDNPEKVVSSDGKPFVFDADGERRGPTKEIDVSIQAHLIPVVVGDDAATPHFCEPIQPPDSSLSPDTQHPEKPRQLPSTPVPAHEQNEPISSPCPHTSDTASHPDLTPSREKTRILSDHPSDA